MEKKIIIIGAGLGGLQCAAILSRRGMDVTVLEKEPRTGGSLQSFAREGVLLDSGLHCAGALGPGESLGRIFSWMGIGGLPWERMEGEEVFFAPSGRGFFLSSGHDAFRAALLDAFPSERSGIETFVSTLRQVGDNIFGAFGGGMNPLFTVSARAWLEQTVGDPLLRKVLGGTALKMELSDSLPLYVYAQITDSFIRSSWRLPGGGSLLTGRLASLVRESGGQIRTGAPVAALEASDGAVRRVVLEGGEVLGADAVISSLHPAATMALVRPDEALRRVYRGRIGRLANTFGMFTVSVRAPEGAYLGRNVYVHSDGSDPWAPDPSRTDSVMVHFSPGGSHADLLSPMDASSLGGFAGLPPGERGEAYEAAKRAKAEECIALASRRFPWLTGAGVLASSSPLTWQSYVGAPGGTAYGIRKDFASPLTTVLPVRTPLGNLLLTGQSLNLHGLLGVSMTSILTCGELLGGAGALAGEILAQ